MRIYDRMASIVESCYNSLVPVFDELAELGKATGDEE